VWESRPTGEAKCTIRSLRSDGRALVGSFTASYDGKPYATSGIPDVDEVSLRRVDESIVDATFSYKGKPVFAYRAMRSRDGESLIIVSVEPATPAVLHSVVVYERQ
jgi:hypothetical protein